MFFDPKEWCLNSEGDMMFNIKTFRTIRRRSWHNNEKPDNSDDFLFFSFHDLNSSQAIAFLFSSEKDAKLVHPQSAGTKYSFDMVDFKMWDELNRDFLNGLPDESGFGYSENEE